MPSALVSCLTLTLTLAALLLFPFSVQRFLFCCQKPHCHSRAERGAGGGRAKGQGTAAALLLASSKEMRKEKQPTHPNLSSAAPLAVATRGSGLGSRELARPEPEVFEKLIPKPSQSKTPIVHPEKASRDIKSRKCVIDVSFRLPLQTSAAKAERAGRTDSKQRNVVCC